MLDDFVTYATEQLAPSLQRWLPRATLLSRLRDDLEATWTERTSADWTTPYAERMALPGHAPDDFALRMLDLGDHGHALAGIHFTGLDPDRPFIGIQGHTRSWSDGDLVAVAEKLAGEFAGFAPTAIQVFLAGPESLDGRPPGTTSDQRLVVGQVADLVTRPRPPGYERVALVAPGAGCYEHYVATCNQLFADRPEMHEMLEIETEDSLRACDACYEVQIDGTWAGLIAARVEQLLGMRGHCMIEEILSAGVRGQKLGLALQRHLIERLADSDADSDSDDGLLWGTINARNIPSRKTATRIGRIDIGGWFFVPVGSSSRPRSPSLTTDRPRTPGDGDE